MKFELRLVSNRAATVRHFKGCTMYYLPLGVKQFRGTINPCIRLRISRPVVVVSNLRDLAELITSAQDETFKEQK